MSSLSEPAVLTPGTPPSNAAPDRPGNGRRRRIGEVLMAAGVIDAGQLEQALSERLVSGDAREKLGTTIVRLGFASQEDIAGALATQLGLTFVPDEELSVDLSAAATVPPAVAERHHVLGLRLEPDGTLVLAASDPTNVVAVDDVRLATKAKRIRLVVATEGAIDEALKRSSSISRRAGDLLEQLDETEDEPVDDEYGGAEEAPIVRLAESILSEALAAGASDVHVEPMERSTVVRYRIDGVLHKVTTIPRSASGALMSRLKLMSNMDIAERRRPQDGRARLKGAAGEVDLRASTLPTMHGETMVMRLLRKGGDRLTVNDLGFSSQQLTRAIPAIERPQGLVLITGPTGSGKTSTLYAFLAHLARETHNIITLEDPVEYQLDGVNQTQINEGIGLTFSRALRTVLRQDPDVVMLGEIRDPEAAEIAIQASLTGHLVFSTLHTNDASGAVVRLRDLDVPSYLISSALTMVMAQRLARRICTSCMTSTRPSDEVASLLRLSARDLEEIDWKVGKGCNRCSGSGYKGRIAVYELIDVADRVREVLSTGGSEGAIRQAARQAGALSLREDGLAKARAGLTTLEEVLRVTPADMADRGSCPTCRLNVEPDFAHCPWCATDLRGLACATCERELAFGWMACPSCGTKTPNSNH
jgi:type IV pilus assembly protein PilB